MWNISRGFKFAHDVEDRQMEGKLGKLCRSEGESPPPPILCKGSVCLEPEKRDIDSLVITFLLDVCIELI